MVRELPFLPSVIQDVYGAGAYPQGLAVSIATDELFVFYSFPKPKAGLGLLCCVYDRHNWRLKTWFVSKELCRESFVHKAAGGRSLIYTLGRSNPICFDLTRPPDAGALVEPFATFRPRNRSYAQLAASSDGFFYMSGEPDSQGRKGKQTFIRTDSAFRQTGEVHFPLDVVGTYDRAELLRYPKAQGVAYIDRRFIFACGKNYSRNPGNPAESPQLASTQQGLIACDDEGGVLADALCDPDFALDAFSRMAGRDCQMIESEGITAAADGKLYGLWQAAHPRQFASLGRTAGLLVTEEMSGAPGATDFSGGAVALLAVMQRTVNRPSR
ncbi:MAG: hypothetical protein ACAH20_09030 [Methylobacteriaceae bacterium]